MGCSPGISFIDSTRLPICSNFRATRNKVFEGLANWGKSAIGLFFGFKLHLIINDKGEVLSFQVTPGNVDDRVPVKDLVKELLESFMVIKVICLLLYFRSFLKKELSSLLPSEKI